jgi:hypothetical protein
MFADSQEILEIWMISVTALSHEEASGGKGATSLSPFYPCSFPEGKVLSGNTGFRSSSEKGEGTICTGESRARHKIQASWDWVRAVASRKPSLMDPIHTLSSPIAFVT